MVDIIIPQKFRKTQFPLILSDIVSFDGEIIPDEITFDFSKLNFIWPAGVVFLSNVILWLENNNKLVYYKGLDNYNQTISYLDDSLFFEQHCGMKLKPSSSIRNTTCTLKKISRSESHNWLEQHLIPWLSSTTHLSEASFHKIKVCVLEIFNNIEDHADLDIGNLFIQHFPKKDVIIISAADFGAGIPAVVRKKCPSLCDSEAIILATKEGFTTKSTPRNRGAGLDIIIDNITEYNKAEVTIYSRNGMVTFSRGGEGIRHSVREGIGFCPGTTFEISIPVKSIINVSDETEDLEW